MLALNTDLRSRPIVRFARGEHPVKTVVADGIVTATVGATRYAARVNDGRARGRWIAGLTDEDIRETLHTVSSGGRVILRGDDVRSCEVRVRQSVDQLYSNSSCALFQRLDQHIHVAAGVVHPEGRRGRWR